MLNALLDQLFPPFLNAVLIVAAWAALTGGLHLDGLADCADGLLPQVDRVRRLEILRDPRAGAFGVIALVLALLLKTATVAAAVAPVAALLLAPLWARWTLLLGARQPSARADGLGARFATGLTPRILAQALASVLLATVLIVLWRGQLALAAMAILAAHGVAIAVIALARRRLGGATGDVLGLIVEGSEVAVLLVFAVQWPAYGARPWPRWPCPFASAQPPM